MKPLVGKLYECVHSLICCYSSPFPHLYNYELEKVNTLGNKTEWRMRKMSRVDKDLKVKMILSSCECLLPWQMFNCDSLCRGRALSHLTAEDCSHACVLEECTVLAGHLLGHQPWTISLGFNQPSWRLSQWTLFSWLLLSQLALALGSVISGHAVTSKEGLLSRLNKPPPLWISQACRAGHLQVTPVSTPFIMWIFDLLVWNSDGRLR